MIKSFPSASRVTHAGLRAPFGRHNFWPPTKTTGCAEEVFKRPVRRVSRAPPLSTQWLQRAIWTGWAELGICQGDPHERTCAARGAEGSLRVLPTTPFLAERPFSTEDTSKSIFTKQGSGLTGLKTSEQMAGKVPVRSVRAALWWGPLWLFTMGFLEEKFLLASLKIDLA